MILPPGVDRTCVHCGKVVAADRKELCNHCGLPFAGEGDPYAGVVAGRPPTIIRTYRGSQQADTAAAFQRDATELAKYGYTPTTQSWAAGQWGCGAFLVALVLCFLLIGIVIFIYLLVVKPEGTLTVTYAMHAPVATSPAATTSLSDSLSQLDAARAAGLLTDDEYAAKRTDLLSKL